MSRRKTALVSVLAVLLVLVIAGAATLALRKPILQAASTYYLEQAGIEAELTISEVGFREIVLEDLRLSSETFSRAEAQQARILYTPSELLSGVLPTLEIRGLRLEQDLPTTNTNDNTVSEPEGALAQPEAVQSTPDPQSLLGDWEPSDIHLLDARYSLKAQGRTYAVEFEGQLQRMEAERHNLELSVHSAEGSAAKISGRMTVSLSRLLPVSGKGWLEARAPELGAQGRLEISGERTEQSPQLETQGTLLFQGAKWATHIAGLPAQDEDLETRLSFDGKLALPAPEEYSQTPLQFATLLSQSRASGHLALEVSRLALPRQADKVAARAQGHFTFEANTLAFVLEDTAQIEYDPTEASGSSENIENGDETARLLSDTYTVKFLQAEAETPFLRIRDITTAPIVNLSSDIRLTGTRSIEVSAGLKVRYEQEGARFTAQGSEVRVRNLPFASLGPHEISGSFELSGSPESYEGHSAIRIDLEELDSALVSAGRTEGQIALDFKGKGIRSLEINLKETGRFSTQDLSLPADLGIPRAELELQDSVLSYRNTSESAPSFTVNGKVRAQPFDFRQLRTGDTPFTGEVGALSLDFQANPAPETEAIPLLTASGTLESVKLDEPGLRLENLSLRANYPQSDDDPPLIQLDHGLLSSTADPALFTELDLTGRLDRIDETLTFTLTGQSPANGTKVSAKGRHSLESGNGTATIALPSQRFVSGGLQPEGLFPLLNMLKNVEGDAAINVDITWNDYGLGTRGQLYLTEIDFGLDDISIEGLSTSLALDNLIPLRTEQAQSFSIHSIALGGLEFDNVSGLLALSESTSALPVFDLVSAQADFADGHLQIENGRFDLTDKRHSLLLKARDLSIEQLVNLLEIENLEAEGRFTGEIPVTVSGSGFEIPEGYLEASRKGRIAFKSEEVRSALASGGEAVMLMLDALENFHYDNLRVEVQKPQEGESRLNIDLEGRNPDVLDGHPFDLNINMSGNLGPILQAIAEGQRLSQDVLDEMLELVR
ncbi:YdbH domain-containing protein [Fodinicurvata halophila]|uniref:YdbH domain-containing protein n=1 Tax=Fodinicurvata halophila TaxID=1419723 RepID=A0ABV8UJJ5_9PROT